MRKVVIIGVLLLVVGGLWAQNVELDKLLSIANYMIECQSIGWHCDTTPDWLTRKLDAGIEPYYKSVCTFFLPPECVQAVLNWFHDFGARPLVWRYINDNNIECYVGWHGNFWYVTYRR